MSPLSALVTRAAAGLQGTLVSAGGRTLGRGQSLLTRSRVRAVAWASAPIVIALLSWHTLGLQPLPGYDYSWHAALQMAHYDGVTFGDQLIFTYGPLGFLSLPSLWYSGGSAVLGFTYIALVRVALAATLFACARRTYGTVAGAILALLVAGASDLTLASVPFLVLCVWLVDRGSS